MRLRVCVCVIRVRFVIKTKEKKKSDSRFQVHRHKMQFRSFSAARNVIHNNISSLKFVLRFPHTFHLLPFSSSFSGAHFVVTILLSYAYSARGVIRKGSQKTVLFVTRNEGSARSTCAAPIVEVTHVRSTSFRRNTGG